MIRFSRMPLLAAALAFLLCGCGVDLYSRLAEQDATAMMAELLDQGIGCRKVTAKEGWTLRVNRADLPLAVKVLANRGYPRGNYQSMGEIFEKKGLLSSPQEDRVRYIYALSQEISQTLTQIDGVLAARVHIVLPENDPLADSLKPSSASVFIKYRPGSPVRDHIAQIKQLVLNGVEGLSLDRVSVVSLPGLAQEAASAGFSDVLGMRVTRNTLPILYGLMAGMLLLAGLVVYLSLLAFSPRRHRPSRPLPGPGHAPAAAVEKAGLLL